MLSRVSFRAVLYSQKNRYLASVGLNSRGAPPPLFNEKLSSDKLSSVTRLFSDISAPSAIDAFKLSCYRGIDYTISEDAT
jgi:hypothetical protein